MKKNKHYFIIFFIVLLAAFLIWFDYSDLAAAFTNEKITKENITKGELDNKSEFKAHEKDGSAEESKSNVLKPKDDIAANKEEVSQKDFSDFNNKIYRLLNYTKTIERIEVCIILNLFTEALEHLDELKKLDFFASQLNEINNFESEIQNLKHYVPTIIFPSENLLYKWIGSFLKIQSSHKSQMKINKKKLLKNYQLFKSKFYENENITKIMGQNKMSKL